MIGPGTKIAQWLNDSGIRAEESGCNCYKLMEQMDQAGAEYILNNLPYWVSLMRESAKQWYKSHKSNKTGQIVRIVLTPIEDEAIKWLIVRACKECLRQ